MFKKFHRVNNPMPRQVFINIVNREKEGEGGGEGRKHVSSIYHLSSKNKNEIRAIACNVLFKPTECPLRLEGYWKRSVRREVC